MFLIRSGLGIMNDLVHRLRVIKFVLCREMKWRLMNLVSAIRLIMANVTSGVVYGDVLFGVRHAGGCISDVAMCGAPSFGGMSGSAKG